MMRILISGGSGLVGSKLKELAENKGHEVSILTRSKNALNKSNEVYWNVKEKVLDSKNLEGFDAIIHLAGAGIADSKWSSSRKKEIISSRVDSANLLIEKLKEVNKKPACFISSSAIGYYGNNESEELNENAKSGEGFLAEVCEKWESSVKPIEDMGIVLSIIRTGVVLSKNGGALPKLAAPVKFFIGSPLGSGKQWVSWIHINDLCNLYLHCIEKQLSGVYNGVAPVPETNKTLLVKVASVLKRPLILPNVPSFALKLLLGEMAAVVLEGQKVSAEKVLKTGFKFEFPKAQDALEEIY